MCNYADEAVIRLKAYSLRFYISIVQSLTLDRKWRIEKLNGE